VAKNLHVYHIHHEAKKTNIGILQYSLSACLQTSPCAKMAVFWDVAPCSLVDTDWLLEVLAAFIIILRSVMSYLCEDRVQFITMNYLGYEW
jgi:hypothetical protein